MDGRRRLGDGVHRWGPFEDRGAAEAAVEATLAALGELLLPHERQRLVESVPDDLVPSIPAAAGDAGLDEATLYEAAARHLGEPVPRVVEAVQVVCAELAALFPDTRDAFVHHPLAPLFTPIRRSSTPAPPPRASRRPTLSSGRPGSEHPVSTAAAERAQPHSVARTDAPHADTKVSSARGLTQEREHESLAEAQPRRGGKR